MYDGREAVSEVMTSDGKTLGVWLFSRRGYEPVVFDDPWEATAWADGIVDAELWSKGGMPS